MNTNRKVIVYMDHKLLVAIMKKKYNKTINNNIMKRIKTKLAIYNLNILYLTGK